MQPPAETQGLLRGQGGGGLALSRGSSRLPPALPALPVHAHPAAAPQALLTDGTLPHPALQGHPVALAAPPGVEALVSSSRCSALSPSSRAALPPSALVPSHPGTAQGSAQDGQERKPGANLPRDPTESPWASCKPCVWGVVGAELQPGAPAARSTQRGRSWAGGVGAPARLQRWDGLGGRRRVVAQGPWRKGALRAGCPLLRAGGELRCRPLLGPQVSALGFPSQRKLMSSQHE